MDCTFSRFDLYKSFGVQMVREVYKRKKIKTNLYAIQNPLSWKHGHIIPTLFQRVKGSVFQIQALYWNVAKIWRRHVWLGNTILLSKQLR